MNLIIDIGNTLSKVAIFERSTIIETISFSSITQEVLQKIQLKYQKLNKAILSSVVHQKKEISNFLEKNFVNFIELTEHTQIPIKNLYKSKKTLGNDRIALAVGANNIFPNTNVLIIDLGTAITYNFVSAESQYFGGNISPGLQMRFKALNEFTNQLPLLTKKENSSLIGRDTEDAIISGVQNGIVYEIDGYVDHLKLRYPDLKVLFTGGEAFFFDKKIKNIIFVNLNLIFIGLNRILEYNVQKK